eukprot:m.45998 g.45998  ORF g.45998 m.45998 type:complete len:68 (+) comp12495_c0_seq1:170-373(+)
MAERSTFVDKWDSLVANALVYTGAGVATGGVLSLALFKRSVWPVVFFAGYGLGKAVTEAEHDFRRVR